MHASFSLFAPLGRLATRWRPAPSAGALTAGWWTEPERPTAPEGAATLRRIAPLVPRARAL